jgi:ABC-type glycerol-3-phosphate transport system permease component
VPTSLPLAAAVSGRAQPGANRGTLMTLVVPVILFVIFQRVFIRGIVITGVEK